MLLLIARASIANGLKARSPEPLNEEGLPPSLTESRATFVTLQIKGQLRGCIGTLTPYRSLAQDVAHHAYAAAFEDTRFHPVTEREAGQLDIHISVLSPATPVFFESEKDLLRQLRPGVDGLILAEGLNRGTFLPSVWEELPEPAEFLRHLKMKSGLHPDYWSQSIKVSRYTTESFP